MADGNIQKIKDVLAFPMKLHMAFDKANADGKVDVSDLGLLIDPVMALPPMVNAVNKELVDQIQDLSDAEKAELHTWVKASYDVSDDKLEATIESALKLALEIASFMTKVLK